MHTITLKSDDNFFEMLNDMVKSLNTTRSELIRQAVINYKEKLEKEKLKEQMIKASMNVREQSLQMAKEWEDTLADGLDDV